jgi:hypothetical protein
MLSGHLQEEYHFFFKFLLRVNRNRPYDLFRLIINPKSMNYYTPLVGIGLLLHKMTQQWTNSNMQCVRLNVEPATRAYHHSEPPQRTTTALGNESNTTRNGRRNLGDEFRVTWDIHAVISVQITDLSIPLGQDLYRLQQHNTVDLPFEDVKYLRCMNGPPFMKSKFTAACSWTLSWARRIQSNVPT